MVHDHRVNREGHEGDGDEGVKMCCEDGKTAEEHRKESPDGKCCTDD